MIDRMYDGLLDQVKQDFFAALDDMLLIDLDRTREVVFQWRATFHQPVLAWLTEWEAKHLKELYGL